MWFLVSNRRNWKWINRPNDIFCMLQKPNSMINASRHNSHKSQLFHCVTKKRFTKKIYIFFAQHFEWDLKLIYFPLCSTRRQLSLCLGCWDVRDMGSAPNAEEEALPLNLLQQCGSKVFLKLNFYDNLK